jgi:hypothetical protein
MISKQPPKLCTFAAKEPLHPPLSESYRPDPIMPSRGYFSPFTSQQYPKINKGKNWLWVVILIVFSIGIFGIYDGISAPSISLPGLGLLYVSDALLLIAAIASLRRLFTPRHMKVFRQARITIPLAVLFILIALEIVRNLGSGLDLHDIFTGLRHVAYYLVFLIVVSEIYTRRVYKLFLLSATIIALITAALTCFQFFTGLSLPGSKVEISEALGIARVYQMGEAFVTLVALLLFASAFSERRLWKWFVSSALFISLVVSFARSSWVALGFALLLVVILSSKAIFKHPSRSLAYMFIAGLVVYVGLSWMFAKSWGENVGLILIRTDSGIADFLNGSGTYGARLNAFALKWDAVSQNSPLLGRGFDWGGFRSDVVAGNYAVNSNPYAPTPDNGIVSIFVIFGYSGILLFIWIFAAFFVDAVTLFRNPIYSSDRAIIVGLIAFNARTLAVCFFTSSFSNYPEVTVLALSWGLLAIIKSLPHQDSLKAVLTGQQI